MIIFLVLYVQMNYYFIIISSFQKKTSQKREMEKEILRGTIVAKRKFAKREYEVMSLQR